MLAPLVFARAAIWGLPMRNILHAAIEDLKLAFGSKPSTKKTRAEFERHVVMRKSRGNVRLQMGQYTTDHEIRERLEGVLAR